MRPVRKLVAAVATVATAISIGLAGPAGAATGPSTTTAPYMLPVPAGVDITSLLTVNDAQAAGNGYEMVGIPDGLGASRHGDEITVYMNHELRDTEGIVRAHGQRGAFVSKLTLDAKTGAITAGDDLVKTVSYWDYPSHSYVNAAAAPKFADSAPQDLTFGRWCSGTLSDPNQFKSGNLGYDGAIWFGNEEDTDNGRAFGVTEDGQAWQLPRLGLFSWENTKPAYNKSATTMVMGQEDGPADASEPWVYVGQKTDAGTPVDMAGLNNGDNHVLADIDGVATTDALWRSTYGKTPHRVELVDNDWDRTGAAQNTESKATGLALNRIEDGHWDPRSPNDFYFVTTAGGATDNVGFPYSRNGGGLWRLRWDDIENPDLGAELTLLADGSEVISTPAGESKLNSPDNMAVDDRGNILIQEDPGNNDHLARIVAYRIADGRMGVVARFDPVRFGPGATAAPLPRLTVDEESSGIIQLGNGEYLFDAQVHTEKGIAPAPGEDTVEEYDENGQLMLLTVKDFKAVYGS